MAMCPSQIWYLMQLSGVSPSSGSTEELRTTGKNKNAKHMFPTTPNLTPALDSLFSQLQKNNIKSKKIHHHHHH